MKNIISAIVITLTAIAFTACSESASVSAPEVVKSEEKTEVLNFENTYTHVVQCADTFELEVPMVVKFYHEDGTAYMAQKVEGEEDGFGMWDDPDGKDGNVWKWSDGSWYDEKTGDYHEDDGSECGSTLIK